MMPFFSLFMAITVYLLEMWHIRIFYGLRHPPGIFARAVVLISNA